MPNTNPVVDNGPLCEHVRARAATAKGARMYPIGAITKGQKGEELSEFGELREAGAVGLSDDGKWLADGGLLRNAFEHAGLFDLAIIQHCEDKSLSNGAPMHGRLDASAWPGSPSRQSAAVARDLLIAGLTGGRLPSRTSRRRPSSPRRGRPTARVDEVRPSSC
jgi:dihydroorotase